MVRRKIDLDKKIEAVEKYKRGEGSQYSIAREYGVDRTSLRQWIANYESMGTSGLAAQQIKNRYSVELKTAAVEAYLRGSTVNHNVDHCDNQKVDHPQGGCLVFSCLIYFFTTFFKPIRFTNKRQYMSVVC